MESWDVDAFMVWHISIFWVVLCVSTILLMLLKHINMEGMLRERVAKGQKKGRLNIARVQLLIVILVAATLYVIDMFRVSEARMLSGLPAVVLLLLGISNLYFLFSQTRSGNRKR